MIKTFYRFLRTNIGLLALAQLLAFTPLRLLSLLLLLVVAARLMPWNLGLFTKLALGFGLAMCLVIFVAVGAWFLNQPLSSAIILSILILILLIAMWGLRRNGGELYNSLGTNRYDIVALLGALAVAILLLWPVLSNPTGSTLLQVSTSGGDNASHLEMIKANDLNRGIVYGADNRVNGIVNAVNYPKGWHFTVAFAKWLTEPLVSYTYSPTSILALFYIVAVVWFSTLIFLMMRLGLRLVEKASPNKHPAALIAPVMVFAAIFMHWLIRLFLHGFQAQIAALVLLLLAVFFLLEAFDFKAQKRWPLLILATIAVVGMNFTWILLSPIGFLLLGVVLIITLVQTWRWPPIYVIGSMFMLGILALVQPVFYKIFPVDYGVSALLQNGNSQQTSMYTFLFMFVLVATYAYFRWNIRAVRMALLFAAVTLVFCLGIFQYQLNEIEELRYFYFKATYAFIIAAAIMLAAAAYDCVALLLNGRKSVSKRLHQGFIVFVVLIIGSMICWQIRDYSVDQYATSRVSGIAQNQIVDVLKVTAVSPENGYFMTFVGGCNRGDDMRATQIAEALSFSDYEKIPRRVSFAPGHHDEKDIFAMINNAARWAERPITVISGDLAMSARLKAYLGDTAPMVTIFDLDNTPETESLDLCPDRSRDLDLFPLP